MPKTSSLDDLKEWLAPLIYENTEKGIGVGDIIKKRDLNIVAKLWFCVTNSFIMPSMSMSYAFQKQLAFYVYRRTIDLGLRTSHEIAMRAK